MAIHVYYVLKYGTIWIAHYSSRDNRIESRGSRDNRKVPNK